ncbi:MAG: poly(3-hydroxyalkanoate) depolymerase [Pseudomonadales bacterium]
MNKPDRVTNTTDSWINIDWHEFRGMRIRYGLRPGKAGTVPLLIFNGVGQSIEVLQPLIDELKDVTIVVYDVPGTGLSDTPILPWRYRQHAAVAGSLLNYLGYEQVIAMGISWGGPLAQQFTKQYPELVQKLILTVSPPGNLMVPGKPGVYWRMAHVKRFSDPSYARSIAGEIYGGSIREDAYPVDAHMARLKPPNPRGYLYQVLAMWGWTSVTWLRRLTQPTLIIQGEDDPMVPNINAHALAWLIPNSQLQFIDCGHMLILTRVPELSRLVKKFMVA